MNPITIPDWLKTKHPKLFEVYPTVDAIYEKYKGVCIICGKDSDQHTTLCRGHRNAFRRWANQEYALRVRCKQ